MAQSAVMQYAAQDSPKRLPIWYLFCPTFSMLVMLPMIAELPPFYIPSNFNLFQVAIALPWHLGLIACPGWLYAWAGHYKKSGLSTLQRVWVTTSLWLAFAASIGGLISILAVIPFPSVVGSLICCILLLRKYYSCNARLQRERVGTRSLGWIVIALIIVTLCIISYGAVRPSIDDTVRETDALISKELPVGAPLEAVLAFLDSQCIEHSVFQEQERSVQGIIRRGSSGFLVSGSVHLDFHFDDKLRLTNYAVTKHLTGP